MSAVKISDLKIFVSMFLLLIFFSCSEKKNADKKSDSKTEEITFIGLSEIGGQLGYYKVIKVTKDSIHFETGTTSTKKHKEWHSAIKPETWKSITSSFKIRNLDSIESSPSIQPIDGIDESFQIKTNKKSHVYVNAQNDIHYNKFARFKQELLKIIPQEYH
ncbi:hypothetical protein [Chryseobacterium balustinum]|uniref:Lipoprotein n=1 Tax=Chryseobacterium balustinum TaxID=246 RepID=A0AAX2IKT1_9FLAO|nr:hypothetical protein [Chryseobacterium balustinum]AZB27979.1 hypothetical protein EB354_01120 [Chryseobacterium balustinum]SKB54905.1 hypothetical protein SAMN05421800_103112 [Chryseobacterium balustinum]SQA89802.1 Uncharacterised protein [Chryseobacterium balustinum]